MSCTTLRLLRSPTRGRAAFTMAEMLVVMAIITILAASLMVVLPRIRTKAMVESCRAQIQLISNALTQYYDDIGHYPTAPAVLNSVNTNAYACGVLYEALTNRHAGGEAKGWGGASTEWKFLTSNNVRTYNGSDGRERKQILDPWGTSYYYIAHPDYLRGVTIYDTTETPRVPNCFGTTELPNDFWGDPGDSGASGSDHYTPRHNYYGPPPRMSAFYNQTTFQIHSKGPDQRTDVDDGDPNYIDACDRGTDADDIPNFGQ